MHVPDPMIHMEGPLSSSVSGSSSAPVSPLNAAGLFAFDIAQRVGRAPNLPVANAGNVGLLRSHTRMAIEAAEMTDRDFDHEFIQSSLLLAPRTGGMMDADQAMEYEAEV